MKALSNNIRLSFDESDKPSLILSIALSRREAQQEVGKLKEILQGGKQLQVTVEQYRKKRSLDANSMAWALMSKMADVLRVSKEEIYIKMLERYGQREPQLISVIAEGVPAIMRATSNHCTEVGESWLNGKLFKHLAILIGSSQFDSRQMAIFIDGIISECKELNIEVMSEAELESLKKSWKGDKS